MFLIFTEDDGWHTNQLLEIFKHRKKDVIKAKLNQSSIILDKNPRLIIETKEYFLDDIEGVFVRGVHGGTLEEVCFYLDVLHFLESNKIIVYNNVSSIEKSVDKVRTSSILRTNNIPTPNTYITSNIKDFQKFRDSFIDNICVIKPIFGSQGKGLELLGKDNRHPDYENLNKVYYVQEFLKSPGKTYKDWRLFIIKDQVISSMEREADTWITNFARGGKCKLFIPSFDIKELAIRASLVLGMDYAGVDIMLDDNGYTVTEVNSIPAWKGLQSVTFDKNIAELIINDFFTICQETSN